MANLNKLLLEFNDKITLTSTKSQNLRTSRDALRTDIKSWFNDNDKLQPKFYWQGSFAMKTLINPLGDQDYDLDDGVYINGYESDSSELWPTTSTVHNWIKDAVKNRTSSSPVDKKSCIRVPYTSGYHIDLPIYIVSDDVANLANTKSGWTESDPKAFREWFVDDKIINEGNGEQLRRAVKYVKAWKDYKAVPLKGIEITILVSNAFDKYDDRDDKSLCNTIQQIVNDLTCKFECVKPVTPNEDLFEDYSDSKRQKIMDELKSLYDAISKAIKEDDEKTASLIMQDCFGDRFPIGKESEKTDYVSTPKPGVLHDDGRSA